MELEPELYPSFIWLTSKKQPSFVRRSILTVLTGCFDHFSQNAYRKIQSIGLAKLYMEDQGLALRMRMLPSLAHLNMMSSIVRLFAAISIRKQMMSSIVS